MAAIRIVIARRKASCRTANRDSSRSRRDRADGSCNRISRQWINAVEGAAVDGTAGCVRHEPVGRRLRGRSLCPGGLRVRLFALLGGGEKRPPALEIVRRLAFLGLQWAGFGVTCRCACAARQTPPDTDNRFQTPPAAKMDMAFPTNLVQLHYPPAAGIGIWWGDEVFSAELIRSQGKGIRRAIPDEQSLAAFDWPTPLADAAVVTIYLPGSETGFHDRRGWDCGDQVRYQVFRRDVLESRSKSRSRAVVLAGPNRAESAA